MGTGISPWNVGKSNWKSSICSRVTYGVNKLDETGSSSQPYIGSLSLVLVDGQMLACTRDWELHPAAAESVSGKQKQAATSFDRR